MNWAADACRSPSPLATAASLRARRSTDVMRRFPGAIAAALLVATASLESAEPHSTPAKPAGPPQPSAAARPAPASPQPGAATRPAPAPQHPASPLAAASKSAAPHATPETPAAKPAALPGLPELPMG